MLTLAPCAAKTYDSRRVIENSRILDWPKPVPKIVKRAPPKPKAVAVRIAPPPAPLVPPRIDPLAPLRQPPYPEASKRFEEEGNVTVGVLVQADGHVARSWIEVTSGYHRLDEAAIATAREWEFIPAIQGDVPVAAKRTVVVRFALEN
ncbi:MAG: energy transducer TonB [Alphaproteobacteria bacterium]